MDRSHEEPTPDEIADVLDAAADVLLRDGWCQDDYTDGEGRACVREAIGRAVGSNGLATDWDSSFADPLAVAAERTLARQLALDADSLWSVTHNWNGGDGRTEDDVHDLLRGTAKALREGSPSSVG